MNPISINVTGRLGDDPRTFTTRCMSSNGLLMHLYREVVFGESEEPHSTPSS